MKIIRRLRKLRGFMPGFAAKVRAAKVERYELHSHMKHVADTRAEIEASSIPTQLLILQLLFFSVATQSKKDPLHFEVTGAPPSKDQERASNHLFDWMCEYYVIDPCIVERDLRRQIRYAVINSSYGKGTRLAMLNHWTLVLEHAHRAVKALGVTEKGPTLGSFNGINRAV